MVKAKKVSKNGGGMYNCWYGDSITVTFSNGNTASALFKYKETGRYGIVYWRKDKESNGPITSVEEKTTETGKRFIEVKYPSREGTEVVRKIFEGEEDNY